MAKKTQTVAERRAELEAQMADLEILEKIEEELNVVIERLERSLNEEFEYSYIVGKEEEQAKDYAGNLLYQLPEDYHKYTEADLAEKGKTVADAVPYYRDAWGTKTQTYDELGDWAKIRVDAYKRMLKFFKNIDVTEVK